MKWMALLAAAVCAPALAMDFAALMRDARAHHARMAQEVGDLKITQSGSFTGPGGGASALESTMWRRGVKWRTDAVMTGAGSGKGGRLETTMLFDGTDLWSSAMGMTTKLPRAQAGSQGAAVYWSEPPAGSTVIGSETIDGRACWVVEHPQPPPNPMIKAGRSRVWIDKAAFVYVRTESQLSGKTVRTAFSDFRRVKGFEIPYSATVTSDGKVTMTSRITQVETGARFTDDLFDPGKLPGAQSAARGGTDLDAAMKRAEEMKKRVEAMQKAQK